MGNNELKDNENRFTAAQERIDQLVDLQRWLMGVGFTEAAKSLNYPPMGWFSVSVFPTLTYVRVGSWLFLTQKIPMVGETMGWTVVLTTGFPTGFSHRFQSCFPTGFILTVSSLLMLVVFNPKKSNF